MSGLVLNVTADSTGLAQIDAVLTRLETLLKNPTSTNLSQLTGQVKTLEAEGVTSASTIAKLEATIVSMTAAAGGATKGADNLNKSLVKTSTDTTKAEASINLLTASYSSFTKATMGANGEMIKTTNLLGVQGAATTDLVAAMVAMEKTTLDQLVKEQARATGITRLNAALAVRVELEATNVAVGTEHAKVMEAQNIANAKLALSEGRITQARYNTIAGVEKEVASVNLLSLSYSEYVTALTASAGAGAAITAQLTEQGAATRALAASMATVAPEVRALWVAEQALARGVTVANKDMALQVELTALINGETLAYNTTIRAEVIALAQLAALTGKISMARYNEIAGIKKATTERVKDTVAIKGQTAAMNQGSVAAHNLNGAMRGAAGASGTLWLSYGAVLPLLAAFATVSGTIKGYKEALNFEYAVGYMEALGRATGDTTASLGELKAGLLGITNVAHGPNDLAVSLKALMKAGFSAAESMSELQTLSRLATVAEEDLAVTTTAVISQFRAWSVESVGAARGVNTMSEAANVLAAAALTTTLDVGELAKMMKYTPVLASQSAASFVELTAALGTMSNMGVRGTTAATSLRTAMLQLQSPTSKTRNILKGLGLDIDLFTSDGKLKSMSGMFDALSVSLKGLTDRKRLELLKSMFSIRAGSAGAIMLNQFNQAIQEGTFSFQAQVEMLEKVRVEGRFIDDMYKDLSKTTTTMWEETKAAWQKVAIGVLDTASIKGLVQSLKTFAEDGSLSTLATGLAVITDILIEIGRQAVSPFTKLGSSFQGVNESVTTLRVMMFGATEGFLAAQNASDLYAKSLKVIPNYTNQEIDAVARLVSVYDSLERAATVQPLDNKISVVQQKFNALKEQERSLRIGERDAGTGAEKEYYSSKLEHMKKYAEELDKLRAEKERLLKNPTHWWSTWDRMEGEKYSKTSGADSAAAALERAQDRRGVELTMDGLRRADILAQDKFELQQLDTLMKDKLVSVEEYRLSKRTINDKILIDDQALLESQLTLANDKYEEAKAYAAGDVPDAGADKAVLEAEKKRDALAQKLRQNRLNQQRADITFNSETASIKLQTEREYTEASLQISAGRTASEKSLALEGLAQEQELLDSRLAAGLVSEAEHQKKKQAIERDSFDVRRNALNSQLLLLEQDEEAKLADGAAYSDASMMKLSANIKDTIIQLQQLGIESSVFEDLITLATIAKVKLFNDELENVRKNAVAAAEEGAFDLSIRTLGGEDQDLARSLRGTQLARDAKAKDAREDGLTGSDLAARITDINNHYDNIDAITTASYEARREADADYWAGATKGLNDYAESTEDVFSKTADLVSSAFEGMEDALVEFATTGKLSFSDLANSIISDMMRIAIQQSITGPLAAGVSNVIGGLLGGTVGPGIYGTSSFTTTAVGPASANGNVFESAGLSAFSGSVVDQPTVFPFASGVGLMGEAGPEAILPLTRGSNGKLGVETSGGSAMTVVVNNYGDAQEVDVQQKQNSSGGTDIVVNLEKQLADRMQNRGSKLSKTFESVYGIRRVGGR